MHIQSCTSWTYTKSYGIKSCKMYTRFAHVFSVVRYQEIYPYPSGFTIIWNSVWCACKRGQYALDTELYLTHISHGMMICIQFVGSSSPKMIWFTCKLRWWGQNYENHWMWLRKNHFRVRGTQKCSNFRIKLNKTYWSRDGICCIPVTTRITI